jgi:hypothetical protein
MTWRCSAASLSCTIEALGGDIESYWLGEIDAEALKHRQLHLRRASTERN